MVGLVGGGAVLIWGSGRGRAMHGTCGQNNAARALPLASWTKQQRGDDTISSAS